MSFSDLGLSEEVLKAVSERGYTEPTPIQAEAIPFVLMGRDILGCAQTGTGKTASFTLPMIDVLAQGRAKARMPRSLILEPTRELAQQVAENFEVYGQYHKLNHALLIGGESMGDQVKVLEKGVDVLIATPGRLLDMFERGRLLLRDVKILVIDEADRMLDMGFIPDVERIVSLLGAMRQTLFFSATMPPEIRRLADAFLMNPKEISVSSPSTPAATVTQGLLMVEHPEKGRGGRGVSHGQKEKREALRALIESEEIRNALVFCNRKRDVTVVYRSLVKHGYDAGQLHGDMHQSVRTETLDKFKKGEFKFMVCSDVAARGLDIAEMSHVFNFDVPSNAEDYIHRIGRTGRAGREGRAFTLATKEDAKYLGAIKNLIGREIPPITLDGASDPVQPDASEDADEKPKPRASARRGKDEEKGPKDGRRRGRGRKADAAPKSVARDDATDNGSDEGDIGWGGHMPAFLQRAPELAPEPKKKPARRAAKPKTAKKDKPAEEPAA